MSCVQKEIKESPPTERTVDAECAALESENEVLKTSLSFGKENQEKPGTEIREMLLVSAER